MSLEEEQQSRETAIKSLERVQKFDVSTLPRENELGMNFRFTGAVEPAKRIVELFRRLAIYAFGKTEDDNAKGSKGEKRPADVIGNAVNK